MPRTIALVPSSATGTLARARTGDTDGVVVVPFVTALAFVRPPASS
jgi:hypothetical protein